MKAQRQVVLVEELPSVELELASCLNILTSIDRMKITIFDLLVSMFVISVPLLVGDQLTQSFGLGVGITAGLVTGAICCLISFAWYYMLYRIGCNRRDKFRVIYKNVYRVAALPHASKIIVAKGEEIQIGDYGWEAAPLKKDGLIYLQGLTENWRVVWHAGFQENQIELVRSKPCSQYDWWEIVHDEKRLCPFPVVKKNPKWMWYP
jgi:hypothetical protein